MPIIPRPEGFRVQSHEQGAFRPMGFDMPEVPDNAARIHQGVGKAQEALDRLLAQQDDARVTDALTKLRRHAIDVESGDNGFRKLQGENALLPDDEGVGLVDRVDADMHEFGEGLAAQLTERQRRLFNERAQPIYTSSYGSVSQHVHDQGVAFQQNAAIASIDQLIEQGAAYAGRPDALAESKQGIIEQTAVLAELRGYSDEQRENLLRKNISGLYMNSINAVMANADQNPAVAYQALGILQNNSRDMLASDVVRAKAAINRSLEILQKSQAIERFLQKGDESRAQIVSDYSTLIEKGSDSKSAKSIVDAWHYGILPEVSAGGHQTVVNTKDEHGNPGAPSEWRYGGSQITVEQAMETAKRHGVTWDKKRFVDDRNYNLSLGLMRFSDKVTDYGGDQSAVLASWFSSDKTVEKAMKSAVRDEAPNNWFAYLPKDVQERVTKAQNNINKMAEVRDANGQKVSAFSPEYLQRLPRWQTAEQARAYFKATDAKAAANPAYLDELVTGAMARVSQQKTSYAQEQTNRMASVLDILWQNGGDMSSVPQSLLSSLDSNQLSELNTRAKKLMVNDQSSDPYVKAKLMTDDGYLLSLSMDELKMYGKGSLSREDYAAVIYRRSMLEQKQIQANDSARQNIRDAATGAINPDFVPSAESVRTALKEDPSYVKFKEDNPEAAAQLEAVMIEALTRDAMRNNTPFKDAVTVRQKVKELSRNYVTVSGTFTDTDKPAFMLQVSDLPNSSASDARDVVSTVTKEWLANKGVINREPTDGEMQEVLTQVMMAKGTSPIPIPDLNDTLARQIEARYQARRGSADPMPRLLKFQAWMIARAGREMPESSSEGGTLDNIYFDTGLDTYMTESLEGYYGND